MAASRLARNIRRYRAQQGISRERLAAVARISVRTLARIEDDHTVPRVDTVQQIAKALGVPLGDLFA